MNQGHSWQLDGNAAELYERYVLRYILGPWVPQLLDVVRLRAGEHVLDVACGTGAVARVAAQRVGASGRVTGLDLNAGMLAVARSQPAPPGAAITWVERNALDTGLPDRSFDVVVCQQGLQFFPDKPCALREMRRVLVPRGRLAISVWRSTGVYNEPPTKGQGARRVWSDSHGRIWVSEWNSGNVSMHDPRARVAGGLWKTWKLPDDSPRTYAVYVDDKDMVWLSDFSANALVRFSSRSARRSASTSARTWARASAHRAMCRVTRTFAALLSPPDSKTWRFTCKG